ncbi:MAG: RNA polymerase sigma factor [Pirellulales bacterium]
MAADAANQFDRLLIARVRSADAEAWSELIGRYEGRLLAFVESRIGNRATSEDVVQETFIGLLTSLPNFDGDRPLESYLFSIAAHKLTDQLRRSGRRPTVPMRPTSASSSGWDVAGAQCGASTMLRSGERRELEETALVRALAAEIERYRQRGDWDKLKCAELLFVRGRANKDVARQLGLSEQTVANYKFEFLARLRKALGKLKLSPDVFPELLAQ